MKKAFIVLWVLMPWLLGLAGAVFWSGGRDLPPPDTKEFYLERPGVAPADNAFTWFLQATNLYVPTTNHQLIADFLAGKTTGTGELRNWVEQNAECLSLVRKGTECPACQMPEVESFETTMPYLDLWMNWGKCLAVQAGYARQAGDFAAAREAVLTAECFGNLIQKNAECLIHYLVGVAIVNLALEQMQDLAREPDLPAQDLQALAASLNALCPFDAGLVRALKTECRCSANLVEQLSAGRTDWLDVFALGNVQRSFKARALNRTLRSRYIFQPHKTLGLLQNDYRALIQAVPRIYAQMDLRDEPKFGQHWTDWVRPNALGQLYRLLMLPAMRHTLKTRCRADCMLSGAQLVVAGNRYQRDRGRWPEALAELEPDYLPEIPRDPYDGQPLRYSAEKGIVWSVGENLTDEGGSTNVPGADPECMTRRNRARAEDFVFELHPATGENEK